MEVTHPKGTARLLHLSLPGSRLLVGEQFDAAELTGALAGPRRNILLYPPTPDSPDVELLSELHEPLGAVRLVVLDGTWRKSRKMLHLNPLLAPLPRLLLHDLPASRYAIRKAHRAGQLSTLEATVLALAPLAGNDQAFGPLLAAFDGFVAAQALAFQSPRSTVATSDTPSGAS